MPSNTKKELNACKTTSKVNFLVMDYGSGFLCALSFMAFMLGLILWRRGQRLLKGGLTAPAIICKNIEVKYWYGQRQLFYPVVLFKDHRKVRVKQELNTGFFPARPAGSKLYVLFDPQNPHIAELGSKFRLRTFPVALMLLAFCGMVLLLMRWRIPNLF